MVWKFFLKRMIPFVVTFSFGLFLSSAFIFTALTNQKVEQKAAPQKKVEVIKKRSCFPINPNKNKSDEIDVIKRLWELYEYKIEFESWLKRNPNAAEKERTSYRDALRSTEEEIAKIRNSIRNEDSSAQNLLHLEKCYEF